ncbi:MAG: cytochrome c3 family protein [Nitrospirota bacterium]
MKKIVVVLSMAALSVLLVATMVFAVAAPGSGIKGTFHDLSKTGATAVAYGDTAEQAGLDRICVYCHAPHHTAKLTDSATSGGVQYLPLWNHGVTTQTYTTYTNGPDDPADGNHLSAAEAMAGQPGSVSKLCLSCHDGTVATNQYGFYSSPSKGAGDKFISAGRALIGGGGDLTNHHPVGFDYAMVKATDDEIADTTATLGSYTIGDLLWAGKMECTTCHDVHNTKNTGNKFLWIEDTNSQFCMACHLK